MRSFFTHPMLASFSFFLFFIWGVSLKHPVLPSFLCGEFLLHIPSWLKFYLGSSSYTSCPGFFFFHSFYFIFYFIKKIHLGCFSYTPRPGFIYFYLGSFSYTSRAGFIFLWGVSLTYPVLACFYLGSFSSVLALFLSGEILLHIPFLLYFSVGSFSYTSHAGFFLVFIWGISLTHPVLASFLSGQFLLHIRCWLLFLPGEFHLHIPCCHYFLSGELLLHIPCSLYFSVRSFSYTSHAGFSSSSSSF